MVSVPYYTLAETAHRLAVGARPLGDGPLIEVDPQEYAVELALKQQLLGTLPSYYFAAQSGSEQAQWEALGLILRDLCAHQPDHFSLTVDGAKWTWSNRLLGTTATFHYGDNAALPLAPLDWVGRQVQEDLLLLDGMPGDDGAFRLCAGQLCFANRWSLEEKLGHSFLDIHAPVPGFAQQIGRSSNLLLERLKRDRPVWRFNWSLVCSEQLDLSTRVFAATLPLQRAVTATNCGETCFVRTERQTLARLAQTGAVLFTVHTYRTPLATLARDPEWAQRFLSVLDTAAPELLAYKGVAPVEQHLRGYLQSVLA
jgi:hypothetical protein